MIWFTSDTHFGHSNIIKLAERPFADVDEMEDSLVANINSLVAPSDELYHLGDFSMKLGLEEQARILRRIRCRNIHLIPGNHDKRLDELAQEGLFALGNPSSNSGATSADTRCATSLSRTGMEKEEAPSTCMAIFAAKACLQRSLPRKRATSLRCGRGRKRICARIARTHPGIF